jgi:hypothetical protein
MFLCLKKQKRWLRLCKGISSSISIWIGSTESTKHISDTLVIGKSNKTIDIDVGFVDPDIGRSFILI